MGAQAISRLDIVSFEPVPAKAVIFSPEPGAHCLPGRDVESRNGVEVIPRLFCLPTHNSVVSNIFECRQRLRTMRPNPLHMRIRRIEQWMTMGTTLGMARIPTQCLGDFGFARHVEQNQLVGAGVARIYGVTVDNLADYAALGRIQQLAYAYRSERCVGILIAGQKRQVIRGQIQRRLVT